MQHAFLVAFWYSNVIDALATRYLEVLKAIVSALVLVESDGVS